MGRETKVVSALAGTNVPVAPIAGYCTDESVNEAPFYVMDFVDGPILRMRPDADPYDEAQQRQIGLNVIDTLVDIHSLDPDEVGLGDLGKKEDYVARTLKRWQGQWDKGRTREIPLIDEVHERLEARIPEQGPATIVHGDYRLDNMILTPDASAVAAVVDWELSTLGDPLADVGMLLVYWGDRDAELFPLFEPATTAPGFPVARRGQEPLLRALGPRPLAHRLLHGARPVEARDHPRGRLRPLLGGPVRRQGRRQRPRLRRERHEARRGGRRGRAAPGLTDRVSACAAW